MSEAYLEHSQKSMVESFQEKKLADGYFWK